MRGALDEAAFARSLDRVVRRHEVLRTWLVRTPSGRVLVIDPDGGWPLTAMSWFLNDHVVKSLTMRGGPDIRR